MVDFAVPSMTSLERPIPFIVSLTLPLHGNGTPLQYSCLENPMDGGAWCAAVHGVPKSRTQLSDFTFSFHFHTLEKEMATHSSVLAWRIPGMGKPGGLPSVGSHRVGHDWSSLAAAVAVMKNTELDYKRSFEGDKTFIFLILWLQEFISVLTFLKFYSQKSILQ